MARILLVAPDEAQAESLRGTLCAWDVTRVGSVLEAIRTAGETPFDAAVLDYDLPDGTGLDLLDFLRIGSPGIRIVLLSEERSEALAMHALSHGAADVLVKGAHLEMELPRSVGDLLATDPVRALVETLVPVAYDEARPAVAPRADPPLRGMRRVVHDLAEGRVLAAGVWDAIGRPVATSHRADLDAAGLGFALATLHGQVAWLGTHANLRPTGYRQLIDVEGGLLAATAIPGVFLVALLFEAGVAPTRAIDALDRAAERLAREAD